MCRDRACPVSTHQDIGTGLCAAWSFACLTPSPCFKARTAPFGRTASIPCPKIFVYEKIDLGFRLITV